MRVAAIQFEPTRGPSLGSLLRLVPLVEQAAAGADLVVCPEMAATGYLFASVDEARAVAETPTGPTFQALSPIAQQHQCWVVCGFAEDAGESLYNSAMVIAPDGSLAFVYRKLLLYDPDYNWAQPGDSGVAIVEIGGLRVSVGICMDLNNPHFVQWLADARIDICAFPTNWVHDDVMDVHTYWQERLAPTHTVLVAANRYGQEDDTCFSGRSAVLSRAGVLTTGPREGDSVLTIDLAPLFIATVPGGPDAQ
ncbi:MAG: putative amidohydrolase [Myxococcota bacterium]|jgi:predicted amidohydrolase